MIHFARHLNRRQKALTLGLSAAALACAVVLVNVAQRTDTTPAGRPDVNIDGVPVKEVIFQTGPDKDVDVQKAKPNTISPEERERFLKQFGGGPVEPQMIIDKWKARHGL
jgi:hypothetical protein